jgi:hypothetical protein
MVWRFITPGIVAVIFQYPDFARPFDAISWLRTRVTKSSTFDIVTSNRAGRWDFVAVTLCLGRHTVMSCFGEYSNGKMYEDYKCTLEMIRRLERAGLITPDTHEEATNSNPVWLVIFTFLLILLLSWVCCWSTLIQFQKVPISSEIFYVLIPVTMSFLNPRRCYYIPIMYASDHRRQVVELWQLYILDI